MPSSSTTKIKSHFDKIFSASKKNRDSWSEEDLRQYFNKTGLLELLGYNEDDIRFEKRVKKKGGRTDLTCTDEYGNMVFIIEFKKPSDKTPLDRYSNDLWDKYVKPLKAEYGLLTNGLEVIIYKRIGLNRHTSLKRNINTLETPDFEKIISWLQKPKYDMTELTRVIKYFDRFKESVNRRHLSTNVDLFFEDFTLKTDTVFSKLVYETMELFDHEYGKSKFLTSAYDFWKKSYAKKIDKLPRSWERLFKKFDLKTTDENNIHKFSFCLETAYALLTRLMLAKACEDYKFPGINFYGFLKGRVTEQRGHIPRNSWGILVTKWMENMKMNLIESIFEEDIFCWWSDKFDEMKDWSITELLSKNSFTETQSFSRCLADVLFTLNKYDFSQIVGDPLGSLYQQYFDKETRKALGEFYTPKEVVSYILDAVDYKGKFIKGKRLLDPACGSGTFLVEGLKRYIDAEKVDAREKGWSIVLQNLCYDFHIVGFDIHPFATIMAQIQFMLALLPYYIKAIEEERTFVLRRIPIFRTDSLIDESKFGRTEKFGLMAYDTKEGVKEIKLKITLPIKRKIKDIEFEEKEIIMPHTEEVFDKTDLRDVHEYFGALQAVFDAVKQIARTNKYVADKMILKLRFKDYLNDKNWNVLASFFISYTNDILRVIKELKEDLGDGRLVKSMEDVILAGLLKNYINYDYVVGNPPYVRLQMIGNTQKEIYEKTYNSAKGLYDLYCLFVERGIKWLNDNGEFGYIISNKFLARDYGKFLREFILENVSIKQILDFGDSGVFKDATNYPCILIMKKSTDKKIINCVRVAKRYVEDDEEIIKTIKEKIGCGNYSDEYISVFDYPEINLTSSIWSLMPIDEEKVFKSMERVGKTKLCKLTDSIQVGVQTGADKIFIMSEDDVNKYEIEKEILKKYLSGEDVRRWKTNWQRTFLLYPYLKIKGKTELISEDNFKKNYPKGYDYLLKHKAILKKRWGVKIWYELPTVRDIVWFESSKILTPDISDKNNFTYDEEGYFFSKGLVYGIITNNQVNIHYLLGLLNSKPLEFYFKHISPMFSGKYYRNNAKYLERFPIKIPKNNKEKHLANLIIDKVKRVFFQIQIEQRIKNFPNSYLEQHKRIEKQLFGYTFKTNHNILTPSIIKLTSGGFGISFDKKEEVKSVETKLRANYIVQALKGKKVNKNEEIKLLIPREESIVDEILTKYNKDKTKLLKSPISTLEEEINELVYDLYGLGMKDIKIIEGFLSKF